MSNSSNESVVMSLDELAALLSQQKTQIGSLQKNTDIFFVTVMGSIILFMQCGFAFLECGAVRSKNTTNILIKNMLDIFVSGVAYWAVGFPFAFGKGNFFIGHSYWFSSYMPEDLHHAWFFHFVFAATAATIVSGAVAERCDFVAYLVYSFVITGFLYPVVTHWAWSPVGWLAVGIDGVAFQDFAGSGVVHLLGGTAALVGAVFLGPRIGRFDDEKKSAGIPGHSVPLTALGGFILMFGFFAFNGGSQFSISQEGDGNAVSRAVMNTIISGSFAAFTCLIIGRLRGCKKCDGDAVANWSLLTTINGALAGMVAICAGCNVFEPWASCVTGIIAAFSYLMWHAIVTKLKIDDPLDAFAVHFGAGFWGILSAPILSKDKGIVYTFSIGSFKGLGVNLLGAVAIIGWSAGICAIMFGLLKVFKILRVSKEIEEKGLDIPKHGEPAYPYQSYGDGWGGYTTGSQYGTHVYPNGIGYGIEKGTINNAYTESESGETNTQL